MEVTVIILSSAGVALLVALVLLQSRRRERFNETVGTAERGEAMKRIGLLRKQVPAPADQRACDRIEAEIRRVRLNVSVNTSIAPKKIWEMAAHLTREIAGIYYPDAENPEMQATLSDMLRLNERIVTRLNQKMQEFPLNRVKDIDIHKILKGKNFYDSQIKNKIEWFKKYESLYKIGSRIWLGYNAVNPWYWGRKLVYTSARELTFRTLLIWVVTIVGEEAMAVYGRRDINSGNAAFERDLAFAMVDMVHEDDGISGAAYAMVLDHVLNRAPLSDTVRVNVLRALTVKGPAGISLPEGRYTAKQAGRLMKQVKRIAAVDGEMTPARQGRLEAIERRLAAVVRNDDG